MELIFLDLSAAFTYLISSFLKWISPLVLGRLYSLDVFIYFWPLLHLLWIFFLFSSVNVEGPLCSGPVFFIPHLHTLLKWSCLPHNFKYYLYTENSITFYLSHLFRLVYHTAHQPSLLGYLIGKINMSTKLSLDTLFIIGHDFPVSKD